MANLRTGEWPRHATAVLRAGVAALLLLLAGCTLPGVTPPPHTLPQAFAAYLRCLAAGPPPPGAPANPNEAGKKTEGGEGTKPQPAAGDKTPATEPGKDDTTAKEISKATEAKKPEDAWYSAHAQATMVTQVHDVFPSPYIGPLSLLPDEPSATSLTSTLFLAARLWEWGGYTGELVFDPEIAGGRGFSGVNGLAGFPNGEITRVGTVEPTPYIARLLLRQTWGLDGPWERVEDAPNQVAGHRDLDRVTLIAGKLSATDFIDDNRYSHDPRTQFLNWSLMYNGAWDYPANVRGYTYGVALLYDSVFWGLHYGIFAEPAIANGAEIDPHILKANGQILEVEEHWGLEGRPGKLREWVYLNHAHMGDYREALEAMPQDPEVTLNRAYRFKYGFGLSFEQELTKDLGLYSRLGWSDGHTETWAFTPIDRTAALGLLLKGRLWCRSNDFVGLAGVINGLARDHRDYLAAGGLDFSIGDGRLNYAPEQILEVYYDCEVRTGIFVTADFQGVNHPAYNADRGPVAIGTVRVHIEF
jgi:high affinity Mn2+ porin